jgi:hypothetical protein
MMMYGIADASIMERGVTGSQPIEPEIFRKTIAGMRGFGHRVHVHTDLAALADGQPLAVVWIQGKRSGRALGWYELTSRKS